MARNNYRGYVRISSAAWWVAVHFNISPRSAALVAALAGLVDAIRATDADTDDAIEDIQDDEAMTRRALDLLGSRRNDAYEVALEALRDDTRQWWADVLAGDLEAGEEVATADNLGLRRFLETKVSPWYEARKQELANRPLVREQAFGEALDPVKLKRLGRYEVHLDRKLERMLAILFRVKDLRQDITDG